jgi:hypothetical protein
MWWSNRFHTVKLETEPVVAVVKDVGVSSRIRKPLPDWDMPSPHAFS